MDIDFEKIRLDCVNELELTIPNVGPDYSSGFNKMIVETSSLVMSKMLIKYHEALNESKE